MPDAPVGVPDSFDEHAKLMFDLQVLAFATEVTRVSSFRWVAMSARASSRRVASATPFHALSHHGDKSATIEEFARLNMYHVGDRGLFPREGPEHTDGDGNLLDHHAGALRQPDGRRKPPLAQAIAAVSGRPRQRPAQGQPSPEDAAGDADGERAVDDA